MLRPCCVLCTSKEQTATDRHKLKSYITAEPHQMCGFSTLADNMYKHKTVAAILITNCASHVHDTDDS